MYIGNRKSVTFVFDNQESALVWMFAEVLMYALRHNCTLEEVPSSEIEVEKLKPLFAEHDYLATIQATMSPDSKKDTRVRTHIRHLEVVVTEKPEWEINREQKHLNAEME